MIDTTDLTSYYPGYDEYCESKRENKVDDRDFYEDFLLEKGIKMERKIIDLNTTNITLEESLKLQDYVWKNNKLIPAELLIED